MNNKIDFIFNFLALFLQNHNIPEKSYYFIVCSKSRLSYRQIFHWSRKYSLVRLLIF